LFDPIASKSAAQVSGVLRIAYAPVLIYPTQTAIEAMRTLKDMLSLIDFDPEKDTDISWQVNRPRFMESGLVNRLSRWETLQAGFVEFVSGAAGAGFTPSQATEFAARLTLDINSDASRIVPIDDKNLPNMVSQLRSLAVEISEKGDLP